MSKLTKSAYRYGRRAYPNYRKASLLDTRKCKVKEKLGSVIILIKKIQLICCLFLKDTCSIICTPLWFRGQV